MVDYAALQRVLHERLTGGALFYFRAEVDEEELLSEQYGRARSRVSYFVLIWYNIDGADVPYVACIKFFVKLPSGSLNNNELEVRTATRLAICSLTRARQECGLFVTDQTSEQWEWYALPPATLKGRIEKLIVATPRTDPRGTKYFMTYYHMTDR